MSTAYRVWKALCLGRLALLQIFIYSNPLKTYSYIDSDWQSIKPGNSLADFYVLVDGKVRFSKKDVSVLDGAIPISIEIRSEDRFLTLVTTQGSDAHGNTNDWSLFAEPSLHLNP